MEKFNDNTIMPTGKYQGEPMIKVPAHYLIWLYENNKCSGGLKDYIRDNINVLKVEAKKVK